MTATKRESARSSLAGFRQRLLARQRELFDEIEGAERDLRVIEQTRESEIEERSQEEAMAALLSLLEDREQAELREIHDALARIQDGAFGICAECKIKIRRERLDALPVARLCARCERKTEATAVAGPETTPQPRELRALPSDLAGLEPDEIAALVRERLQNEIGDPMKGLQMTVNGAEVTLSGELASDEVRRVLVQVVEDEMGLGVVDRVRITQTADVAKPSRWPVRVPGSEADTAYEAAAASPDSSEDVFRAEEEGVPYTPPDRPVPGEE